MAYRSADGKRGFVGVETKYTEPFSPTVYTAERNPRYALWTSSEHGFRDGAVGKLERKAVNQLWRNALLAVAVRSVQGFDRGHVAVLACEGDKGAAKALHDLRAQLDEPGDLVRSASLEALVARARRETTLATWADSFDRRYLDRSALKRG